MAVRQRIIKAQILSGVTLYHDDYVKFYVYEDTGAPSRDEVLGTTLNYDIESSGGYLGDGIQYTKMYIEGCNGGTTKQCWFQLYFDKTEGYDLASVSLPAGTGINGASLYGTSINIDENDAPDDAFEALFASTPTYIALRILRGDNSTTTKALTLKSDSELHIYMGYNVSEAQLGNPGTPTITEHYDGTYTASWSAASASGGTGSVQYQWWDVTNGGYWSNWSTATSVRLDVPSYGYPYEFRVRAQYSGLESYSTTITKTFTAPSVTKPGAPTIIQNSNGTFKASWTAAEGSYGTGDIKYQLYYGGVAIGNSTTGTSITATIPSYGTVHSFTVKATYSGVSATSNATSFTFTSATLTAPGKPTVTSNNATYNVSWTAASASNGTGSIYYRVIISKTDNTYNYTTGWQTGLTYSAALPSSGTFSIAIEATYNNASTTNAGTISKTSESTQAQFVLGSLTSPGKPTITQNNDGTFTASWTAATGTGNVGSVYYRLYNVTSSTYLIERTTGLTTTLAIPAYGTTQTYRVMATYGSASSSANGEFVTWSEDTTHTFNAPSLTNPGTPTITQNNDGTFTASWTKATGTNGQGSVYYQLINTTNNIALNDNNTLLEGNYPIPTYGIELNFKVKATYNNASSTLDGTLITYSSEVKKTFKAPSLSAPTLSIAATSGQAPSLSWTKSVLSNTTGSIIYRIFANDLMFGSTEGTSFTIPEAEIVAYSPLNIIVQALAQDLSNVSQGYSLVAESNSVSFTHQPTYTGATNLVGSGTNTLNLTWTKGSTSYGKITYSIFANDNPLIENISGSVNSYLIPENILYNLPANSTISIKTYHSITNGFKTSNTITFTYTPVFNGATNVTSNGSGSQAIITWTEGNVSYGEIVYDIYLNGAKIASDLTSSSYTILEDSFSKASNSIYVVTRAPLHNKTSTSNTITFNYIASVIKHTVGYRKGGRNHNCLIYVCVNGTWIKCAPYIYTNGKWQICSTT